MKIRFLSSNFFFSLVLYSCLLGSEAPNGYKQIECTIIPIDRNAGPEPHLQIPGPKSTNPRAPKNQETSTNWCGYAAANNLSNSTQNSVSEVFGSWIVPIVKPSSNNSYSAIWVGIDGYSSPTVEQIGTSHNFINGKVQHYAWFEMYPKRSYQIKGFPLNPGDLISASVQYSGNNIFTLTLYNTAKKITFTVPINYTKSKRAQRRSAEWIVEAPWLNHILPLANFEIAYLGNCMATINGVTALLSNNAWQNISLEMVTNSGATKATPSSPVQENGSFHVTWQHQ